MLSLEDPDEIRKTAELVVFQGISVRELERLVKKKQKENPERKRKEKRRVPFFDEVELALREHMGRKVVVSGGQKQKGILQIEFYNEEDLADLARRLGGEE